MNCDEARALFSALLDGEPDEDQAEALEAHFAGCEPCRREARRAALVDRLAIEAHVEDRRQASTSRLLRVARPVRPSTTRRTTGPRVAAVAAGVFVAAGILALVAAHLYLSQPDPVPPVVNVTAPPVEVPVPPAPPKPILESERPAPDPLPAPSPAPKPEPARAETPPAFAGVESATAGKPAPLAAEAKPESAKAAVAARPAPTVVAAATLERGDGEVYVISSEGQTRIKSGQPLFKGQGVQTLGPRSRALLTYSDGTTVEMRGEATLRDVVTDEDEVFLSEGAITVKVADHLVAFSTPHAEAKARESSLSLSVTDEGTQMRVIEGRAQWTRRADGVTLNVAAGAPPVWALAQDPKAPPPAAAHPKVDQKKVDEAIKKGIAYLKGTNADSGRTLELALWTYIHAGLTEEESHVKVPLDKMMAAPLAKTYNVALQAMILEKLDRVRHQKRIFHCGQFLADNQWDYGQWGYGSPTTLPDPPRGVPTGDRPKVSTSGRKPGAVDFDDKAVRMRLQVTKQAHDPGSRGDDSNSQYAHLGLRACHDAGILFPAEVLARADKWWRESQVGGAAKNNAGKPNVATGATGNYPPAGWGYFAGGKGGTGAATGSMTVGGLGALAILDYIQGKNWRADADVVEAVNWVAANFSVTENPGRGATHHYYYLYGLERAGVLYGTEFFGTHEWYPLGANYLIENQKPDGSWAGGGKGDGPIDTCFAILFLKRATRPLQDVATTDTRRPVPNK